MDLSCLYHPLGETKVVKDDERKKLLNTGIWFTNSKAAWEYKYLSMPEYKIWSITEGAHFLAGENPDRPPPIDTDKYKMIMKEIENDFIRRKLKLEERHTFKGEKIFFILNADLIQWAIQKGFDVPTCCIEYKEPISELPSSTPSQLGKKGSDISNKKHRDTKVIAQTIAKEAWKENPDKTKEDIATLVLAKLQERKIFNVKEPYSSSTVCDWIKPVMPNYKKKGGRPKKIN